MSFIYHLRSIIARYKRYNKDRSENSAFNHYQHDHQRVHKRENEKPHY